MTARLVAALTYVKLYAHYSTAPPPLPTIYC